jgi:hypothetical protein
MTPSAPAAATPVRLMTPGEPTFTTLGELTASLRLTDLLAYASSTGGKVEMPSRAASHVYLTADPDAKDSTLVSIIHREARPGTLVLAWVPPETVRNRQQAIARPGRTGWRLTVAGFYNIELAFADADDLAALDFVTTYLYDPESALTLAALAAPEIAGAVAAAASASAFARTSSRRPILSRSKLKAALRDILPKPENVRGEEGRASVANLALSVGKESLLVAIYLSPPSSHADPQAWMDQAAAALGARQWRQVDLPAPWFAAHALTRYTGRWFTLYSETDWAQISDHAAAHAPTWTRFRRPL